jgi:alpha-aminoadipate carrier protein LysW
MANAVCPECAAAVPMGAKPVVGEVVSCPECGVELEIVSLSPPKVELAPEVEEDWGE